MVYGRQPSTRVPTFSFGGGGPVPPDVVALLVVVFVTFTLQFFAPAAVALLRLTPLVWQSGFVWQAASYPFAGFGGPSIWFLLELLILFWFGRDVFRRLGRKGFWRTLAWGTLAGAAVALVVQAVAQPGEPIVLMQGQRMLIVLLIAAFATLFGSASIYLFFVLRVEARWFLPIEVLIAFMGYLGSGDLAGFLGICAGIATVWWRLRRPGRGGGGGGPRDTWLRLQGWWLDRRLKLLRRRRGFTVVPGDRGRGGSGGGGGPYRH